jgi:hypothetical protein
MWYDKEEASSDDKAYLQLTVLNGILMLKDS